MIIKVYYENEKSTQGGWEYVGFFKLMWWIFLGRIKPKDNTDLYYIRKLKTISNKRI